MMSLNKMGRRRSRARRASYPKNRARRAPLLRSRTLQFEALEERRVLDAHSLPVVTFVASNDFEAAPNGYGVEVRGGQVDIGFTPVPNYAANPEGFLAHVHRK